MSLDDFEQKDIELVKGRGSAEGAFKAYLVDLKNLEFKKYLENVQEAVKSNDTEQIIMLNKKMNEFNVNVSTESGKLAEFQRIEEIILEQERQ